MRGGLKSVVLLLCALLPAGCAYLRVPRIDPTGERIFAEPPIAAVPQYRAEPGPRRPGDDVAVTLSPGVTVAPVGSEVVLLAGVLGPDSHLRTNRRLEWSLSPGGVGHFVAVGKNRPIDLLLGDFNRPRKVDNSFAIGSTSPEYLRLDRGTPTPEDDLCVLSGQGWITLTSPVEGTSRVTVYAPDVHPWDSRTRSAVVHWVDAQWGFPPPAINPAGTPHVFTTTVVRSSDRCPCVGWLVRYEIVDGPAAGFAPDGAGAVEVATDAAGQAGVEIFQQQPGPGTNRIAIQVIRPAALEGPNGKRLVVGSGTTLKTWTSPDLAIQKAAPAVATPGATMTYRIEVSNPGDQPAEDVVVTDPLPQGLTYLQSNPAAEVDGQTLRWQLGVLGPGQCRVIELNCNVPQQGSLTNCVDAAAAGGLKASAGATTTVVAPTIDVRLSGPTEATVGSQVTFSALVTNPGQVPLTGLLIRDRFGAGLEHAAAPSPIERELGDLAPGESRQIDVTFRVTRAGRLCHTVEVAGPGGVGGSAEACLTAVEPAPAAEDTGAAPSPPSTPRPSVTVKKSVISRASALEAAGLPVHAVGETAQFRIEVTNNGTQPVDNLTLIDEYDPSLDPQRATPGFRFEGNNLVYRIASLPAGGTEKLDVLCRCLRPAPRVCNRATVTTRDGFQAQDEACLEIRAAPAGLTINVADLYDQVAAGKELTYLIQVANQGQTPQRQVTVVATVPEGMMPVRLGTSGPGDTKWAIEGQTVRFQSVAELRPAESLTYRVRVLTSQPGKMTFRAELHTPDRVTPLSDEATTNVF